MSRAFVFPGQGSQIVGMGKDFYENFTTVRDIFNVVDETLGQKLSSIIFKGPAEELTLTTNAQPALMAVSIAIINVLKEQTNKNITELCNYVAGHSLGEYSALCAVSSISLPSTARLLHVRSNSMQEACPQGEGAMAACIGINLELLEKIVNDVNKIETCQIANDNIIGQVVISGKVQAIDRAIAILKDLGYKAIKLKVSAPFHSILMQPAEEKMKIALDKEEIYKPLVPIIQNYNAKPVTNVKEIKQNLISQICGKVRWRETLEELHNLKVKEIIEIGASNVLTGMLKKTNYQFKHANIGTVAEMENYLKNAC